MTSSQRSTKSQRQVNEILNRVHSRIPERFKSGGERTKAQKLKQIENYIIEIQSVVY